jgi:hypothetical protein
MLTLRGNLSKVQVQRQVATWRTVLQLSHLGHTTPVSWLLGGMHGAFYVPNRT